MKKFIAIAVIGSGLLWGCQAKTADQTKHQPAMDHSMSGGMNHEMSGDMDHEMGGGMDHKMGNGMRAGDGHDHGSMGKMDHKQMNVAGNIAYYTCPMESHKYIHSSKPGSCPECGMALVAAVEVSPDQADYFGCPMPAHSDVRSDKPGQCPECGMDLKPYKLEKTDS